MIQKRRVDLLLRQTEEAITVLGISDGRIMVGRVTVPGMFMLRSGATPPLALSAIDGAMQHLQDAQGQYPSSPAAEYVKAIPGVEAQLKNAFDHQWVEETLLTPRYWHLMEVAHLTIPEGVVGAAVPSNDREYPEWARVQRMKTIQMGSANAAAEHERRMQMERLEKVKADVTELDVFASTGGKVLIIDTNTLMHAYPLDKITWTRNDIAPGAAVRAMVPLAVVDELDRKKFEGGDNMRRKAANAIKSLYGHRKGIHPDVPAMITAADGTTLLLEIPRDDLGRTRSVATDDEIRDFGLFVKQVTGRPVTVVTRDMGLQVRCERVGLSVLWLHDDDMKQDQPNTKNTGPEDKDSGRTPHTNG